MTRLEVIKIIEDFLSNTVDDPWAWDDFLSVKSGSTKVETVKVEIHNIYHRFPAEEKGWWCSVKGIDELEKLIVKLKSEKW